MKSLVVHYELMSDKVVKDKSIVLISDLHDYPGGRKNTLASDIAREKPDMIVIAGDILSGAKFSLSGESYKQLRQFLAELAEVGPVILGLGNHDLFGVSGEFETAYHELETVKPGMIFPLSNEHTIIDGVRLIEFHPRHDAFSPSGQKSGLALRAFAEDFEKAHVIPERDGIYNILICHSPSLLAQARSYAEHRKLAISEEEKERLERIALDLRKVSLGLSGHGHGGYYSISKTQRNPRKYMDKGLTEIPMEKNINGRIVMIRPYVYTKTDLCRGTVAISDLEARIYQFYDGEKQVYFYKEKENGLPFEISAEQAMRIIDVCDMLPIAISSGINRYFNLPIGESEITHVHIRKK